MASSEEAWKRTLPTYQQLLQQSRASAAAQAAASSSSVPVSFCATNNSQHTQRAVSAYQQPAPPRSVPVSGAYQQPAPRRSARAAAREEQPASEFFWDQLPTDALTMIIREAADMRLFAATSKAVRELAINSFYELEIGDSFDDEYERRFWPSDVATAPSASSVIC